MATGGRVLHHLARFLPDPANTVIFVGFQASGTRGRRLLDGEDEIRIHGQLIPARAAIESVGSLSAHADANEIMRWLAGFSRPPKKTFIIHGEPDAAQALRDRVEKEMGWNAVIPTYQETVELE
jgi:metallo-beta-lactamase family protein